jgi:hypothetical protein
MGPPFTASAPPIALTEPPIAACGALVLRGKQGENAKGTADQSPPSLDNLTSQPRQTNAGH